MKQITWMTVGITHGDKGLHFQPAESHPTKRDAVQALRAKAKVKTAIVRIGHTYQYEAA